MKRLTLVLFLFLVVSVSYAANGFGKIGSAAQAAVPALIQALNDNDTGVRRKVNLEHLTWRQS